MNNSVQLVNSEQRFRSLFENNPDLVLFQDADGIILDANPAFLSLLNKEKDEVLNRPLARFLPPVKVPLFNQKLVEAVQGNKVRFTTEVQFDHVEPRVFDINKVPLWVDGTVQGVHAVFRDITAVMAAQLTIEQQAHKLNTIFESINDAFFLLDRDWRFVYANAEVERLIEVRREQLMGRNIWEAFPEEVSGEFRQQYEQAVRSGQPVHFQAFFGRTQLWFDVKAAPSEEGLSVYFSDVTDRVKAHEELYRQNQDLQQFTYIVSHNLRAPLANVMGLVDLLTSLHPAAPEFGPTLAHLQVNSEQLDEVLRDMNTILAIRDTQGVAASELVPLLDVLEQAQRGLEEPLRQSGGVVHLAVSAELRVSGNRAYLYSVFFNLLSNAIKYRSDDRPLRVAIEATRTPGNGVRVTVADNGSGFDLQRAGEDVFKLYKRFHTQQPGRGMGLYLVKNHLEAMGGYIEVSSAVGQGTCFTIHLR